MARSKNGQAIREERRVGADRVALEKLLVDSKAAGDLATWRRARAVLRYLDGKKVIALCEEMDVCRASINGWLSAFDSLGAQGLLTRKAPGPAPKLTQVQRDELIKCIEEGPLAAGFTSGMWTGPMIGQMILAKYGVSYHNHHVPRLLHQLGFSVQRPRKRLAKADHEQQEIWLRERLPAIKKPLLAKA